jgi:hypothetical protein
VTSRRLYAAQCHIAPTVTVRPPPMGAHRAASPWLK